MSETGSTKETDKTEPSFSDDVAELLKEVRSAERKLSRAKNLLKEVAKKEPEARDFEAWLELQSGLEGLVFDVPALDEKRTALVERLQGELKKLRVKARMSFLTKLDMLAGREELAVERVSEAPLVLFIKPLTFEVDFEGGGVRMLYGHEPIEELPIDAAALMTARTRTLEEARKKMLPSEEFFDLLLKSYRTVVAANGVEPASRIDLVDVLVPLAMHRAGAKALRKKGVEALETFPRHLLAMQLAKLRRDGMLEKDGRRLDLGAATGGSTRDKNDVLYIPVGSTSGQYYVSLKFDG